MFDNYPAEGDAGMDIPQKYRDLRCLRNAEVNLI